MFLENVVSLCQLICIVVSHSRCNLLAIGAQQSITSRESRQQIAEDLHGSKALDGGGRGVPES
jgi:hypothetical protein